MTIFLTILAISLLAGAITWLIKTQKAEFSQIVITSLSVIITLVLVFFIFAKMK